MRWMRKSQKPAPRSMFLTEFLKDPYGALRCNAALASDINQQLSSESPEFKDSVESELRSAIKARLELTGGRTINVDQAFYDYDADLETLIRVYETSFGAGDFYGQLSNGVVFRVPGRASSCQHVVRS